MKLQPGRAAKEAVRPDSFHRFFLNCPPGLCYTNTVKVRASSRPGGREKYGAERMWSLHGRPKSPSGAKRLLSRTERGGAEPRGSCSRRLTTHQVYGEATAVLAGDALLTAAFGHLAAAPLPASRVVKATRVLSLCAGELGMVGGQVLDMEAEHRVCTEEEVLAIQSRKTGALISAACQLGVIAAGGSPAQQQAAADYAASLGLAFQIEDDILDVVGDAAKLGKATGMDQNKNTFVRLHGVEACRARITEETQRAVAALAPFGQAEFLTELAQRLTSRDH